MTTSPHLTNPTRQLRIPVSPLSLGTQRAFPYLIPNLHKCPHSTDISGSQECPKNQTDVTMTRSVFQERMSTRPFSLCSPVPTNGAAGTQVLVSSLLTKLVDQKGQSTPESSSILQSCWALFTGQFQKTLPALGPLDLHC